jgi:hypothetical protein
MPDATGGELATTGFAPFLAQQQRQTHTMMQGMNPIMVTNGAPQQQQQTQEWEWLTMSL